MSYPSFSEASREVMLGYGVLFPDFEAFEIYFTWLSEFYSSKKKRDNADPFQRLMDDFKHSGQSWVDFLSSKQTYRPNFHSKSDLSRFLQWNEPAIVYPNVTSLSLYDRCFVGYVVKVQGTHSMLSHLSTTGNAESIYSEKFSKHLQFYQQPKLHMMDFIYTPMYFRED